MISVTRGLAASCLLLVSVQAAAAAVSIHYSVVPMGGNVYRYVYSVSNSSGSPAAKLFDIHFATSLYDESSLQIVTEPGLSAQWAQQILVSVPPSLPAAYSSFALSGGIPAGSTVTGFSVQFTWLGPGSPGSQEFQVFDATTFTLLETGVTAHAPQSIPAASTLSLALLSLAMAVTVGRQMRLRAAEAIRSHSPVRW